MTTTTSMRPDAAEHAEATDRVTENIEDAFALEVHVVSEVRRDLMPTACDTNDGCKPTCASACTST
ncbi:FxLD family lanthipeptide [Streptomyces sp. TRM 70351]|uniref:FxLD family lanthipeptide n=1 Tax=Streptomyces sp. TRM 70351 TaxID=3116552 RepID=UPI002E7C215C|nr:FxLD family lanthipeptide [Streptomyces sp. TRM 70351]MEE1931018.1 FxLD family lanthipeptide [Streptomyces sp. TRM 70351]